MKKPYLEIKDYNLETVEDLINALMQVPKGYLLHPCGKECSIAVDNYNHYVILDESMFINDYKYELENDIKNNGDDIEVEVEDDALQTYSLNAVIGYSDNCNNGNYDAQLMGIFSNSDLAMQCGNELVDAEVIKYYEIENPKLDEFGYR